ncbi:formate dehydrogenase accessory sulfurtransferase FdhD [Campylobacter sp. FMV-PI01]|uniref:Formate dehydrogenase accessory sulfurtransferase FdhD n=1 Tax=Campylobacter portucalensis TaxID=2608384 RepID=A0A6L5WFT5_9BACT|nr:formate dehydrogenase accessory sulfurtransferase FdhD [Campylobacter portucalensis]MSN95864.1 formate dehydrogenase accessory sulfurtransferase FdhD [Campylobacter portucalensis]
MEPIYSTKITKFKSGEKFEVDDILVREVMIDIILNDEKIGSVMATPVDEKALVYGYLISEGLILNDIKSIESKFINDFHTEIYIEAKQNDENLARFKTSSVIVSGCGSVRSANLNLDLINAKKLNNNIKFSKSLILSRMAMFYTQCDLYEQTGCVHTAKLFVNDDEFYIGEDIAQHNTIDKALGKARLNGANLENSFLMVSGRLSSEMVAKAVMHGVPALISRTAPTYLGVEIARKFNLTLCGFARNQNINVYSGALF